MSFDIHDPKWTAYVLGELDTTERSAIEAQLQSDPEAQALVAEIRRTVGMLSAELQTEPCLALTDAQRARVADRDHDPLIMNGPMADTLYFRAAGGRRAVRWLALAASLLLAVGLGWLLRGATGPGEDVALVVQDRTDLDQARLPQGNLKIEQYQPADGDRSKWRKREGGDASQSNSPPLPGSPGNPQVNYAATNNEKRPDVFHLEMTYDESKLQPGGSDKQLGEIDLGIAQGGGIGGGGGHPSPSGTSLSTDVTKPASPLRLGADGKSALGDTSKTDTLSSAVAKKTGAASLSLSTSNTYTGETIGPGALLNGRVQLAKSERGRVLRLGADSNMFRRGLERDWATVIPEQEKQIQDLRQLNRGEQEFKTDAFDYVVDNRFLDVNENPLSTFSIDVDTASYSIVRRFLLQQSALPPKGAVRIEEMINYFTYDYPQPKDDVPFAVTTEVADCPWQPQNRLVRIGLKGREIPKDERPNSNLVFLIDVSGSMTPANKLPLVQQAMKLLVDQLRESDRVAIVVYAGTSGLVLPSTTGDKQEEIKAAIDRLSAGGSTNGAQGLELAYEIALANFIKDGSNRVLLATDGDFNVGVTSQDELVRLIEEKTKTGVFFTALGFGYGNLKDSTLEKLADKGNGQYAYIDDIGEARKVFVNQLSGTLITIAKDVKLQIEFNPAQVASYRLIGYENRVLAKEDFNDDKKDAGDIGAGHTVTALYELTPVAKPADEPKKEEQKDAPAVDPLKYQKRMALTDAAQTNELFTLKLRYKQPDGDKSRQIETPVKDEAKKYAQASVDFKFAAAVSAFGMILRDSPHKGNATLDAVLELAAEGKGSDSDGYRAELISLVEQAKKLGSR